LVQKYHFSVAYITTLFVVNNIVTYFLSPAVGKAINRYGERTMLTIEYSGLFLVFMGYALVENHYFATAMYLVDNLFFSFVIAINSYFRKQADPQDIAPSMSAGFTINHLTAVALPVIGGFLWTINWRIPFLASAGLSLVSLFLAQMVKTGKQFQKQKNGELLNEEIMKNTPRHKQSFVFGGKRMYQAPSSYKRDTAEQIFEKIGLKPGQFFIDLGCGTGNYSLHAAEIVGKQGKVFAADSWAEMLEKVNLRAKEACLTNIATLKCNICDAIEIDDNVADVCFISNVLHGQKVNGNCNNLLPEIVRIINPGALLGIIEFKKEEMRFGPPLSIRISPEELEKGVSGFGFQKADYLDLGHNYLMVFKKE
jgi:SAM-dependent methyltransferase